MYRNNFLSIKSIFSNFNQKRCTLIKFPNNLKILQFQTSLPKLHRSPMIDDDNESSHFIIILLYDKTE